MNPTFRYPLADYQIDADGNLHKSIDGRKWECLGPVQGIDSYGLDLAIATATDHLANNAIHFAPLWQFNREDVTEAYQWMVMETNGLKVPLSPRIQTIVEHLLTAAEYMKAKAAQPTA